MYFLGWSTGLAAICILLTLSHFFSTSRFLDKYAPGLEILELYKDRYSVVARAPGDGRFRESYFQADAGLPPVDACAHHPMAHFPSYDF